jgi:hypothetical protein
MQPNTLPALDRNQRVVLMILHLGARVPKHVKVALGNLAGLG